MNFRSLPRSSVAKHLSSAVLAGAVVYLKPARVPKRLRQALLATNAGGSAAAMLVGSSGAQAGAKPAPLAARAGSNPEAVGDAATLVAALASSVTLLTSKPALKLDRRIETTLERRGFGRPRLVMAVGSAGLVVLLGVATDRLAKAAERKVAELQEQDRAEPATTAQVNPPHPSLNGSVVPDQQ